MTRRDYVRIAAALREAQRRIERTNAETARIYAAHGVPFDNALFGLQIAAEALADALAADNPRFDRGRFLDAAEGGAA